jgi:hypothetical protein|tara:strand:+ start:145 stop:384 length:240 start_codon:yes stop_codon:yes gene_type:complete
LVQDSEDVLGFLRSVVSFAQSHDQQALALVVKTALPAMRSAGPLCKSLSITCGPDSLKVAHCVRRSASYCRHFCPLDAA